MIDYSPLFLSAFCVQLNMHLFDVSGQIRKFPSALAVLHTYFPVRLSFYTQRRTALLAQLHQQLTRLTQKSRFIQLVTTGRIHIVNAKRADLVQALAQHGLVDGVEQLLDMRVSAFSAEEVERLEGERVKCEAEVRRVEGLTTERMWEADLDRLEARLVKLLDSTTDQQEEVSSIKKADASERREKQSVRGSTTSKHRSSSGREKVAKTTIENRVAKSVKKQLQ